ncbi:MAG TPA: selenocysteine-specific translation elongation factor [Gemmatimonadales bacterium]|jgi:selenocysteine-specific elongation factor
MASVEPHVVIGTAGHIDHGKTTLVKALTGVDTDRLAEEKARGITIDLGFAPLDLDGLHASVVDVPGHEGFIRNMVAGATGIDLALLVVAADEGVMPQTREHLAILRHLGVERGVVALTKTDASPDAGWQSLVADDIAGLLDAELKRRWPIIPVSATSGAGLSELRATLLAEARKSEVRAPDDRFRMPVDRVFALAGAGTIVTGTVWSGSASEGDAVTILPAARTVRIRSIQVHGAPAPGTAPGRRTALALVGLSKEEAARGSVVVTGEGWRAARAIDVAVTLAAGVTLKLRSRVHLHHGTSEVMARVSRIGESEAGLIALRLRLDEPLVARAGDRLVLRSWSPVTTIGGGVITDPFAERPAGARRRQGPPSLPAANDAELVARLVSRRAAAGMTVDDLSVAAGLSTSRLAPAIEKSRKLGITGTESWLVARSEIDAAQERMAESLAEFHRASPLEPGMSAQAWRAAARAPREELVAIAENASIRSGAVIREGALVRQKGWNPSGGTEAQGAAAAVLEMLRKAGAEPPSAAEIGAAMPGVNVAALLRLLARDGQVAAVGERYYEKMALEQELERLTRVLAELGPSSPAAIRERLGLSRKWLIPLLEWADREGVTVRSGDLRALRNVANA